MRINVSVAGVLLGILWSAGIQAQNYHAVEGSPWAGSLGVSANPASILSTPYPWDITIFSLQYKNATNAVTLRNYSLLNLGDTAEYKFKEGNSSRYINFNYNIHLLNARFALGRKQAIAFGANLRGYGIGKTGTFNYSDTIQSMNQFFSMNQGNLPFEGNVVSSHWLELFATYSRTLRDDAYGRLNAGITLKGMRGIGGGFLQLNGGTVSSEVVNGQIAYLLKGGVARYGYSGTLDEWKDSKSTVQNIKDLIRVSQGGLAVDLGVEYLVKTQAIRGFGDDEDDYYDYEWKIGAALLDIGQNQHRFGVQSRLATNPKNSIADSNLDEKFSGNFDKLADLNDSLATVVNNFGPLVGFFNIRTPARLVVNVDKPLQDHFAVNASLTVNLGGNNNSGKVLAVKEMNLLTLTPRWEKKNLGVYLPVQVTTQGRLWIGGAFKAGPLLLGVHNWANVFSKSKMQYGGAYLAIVIRPGNGFRDKTDKRLDCPTPAY